MLTLPAFIAAMGVDVDVGADWQADPDAAREAALAWIARTAEVKGWSAQWATLGAQLAEDAGPGWWEAWYMSDAGVAYWSDLAAQWAEYMTGAPAGWSDLLLTFQQAAGAADQVEQAEQAASGLTIIAGTAEGAAEDVASFTDPDRSVVDPKGYKFWILAAAAGGLLWMFATRK